LRHGFCHYFFFLVVLNRGIVFPFCLAFPPLVTFIFRTVVSNKPPVGKLGRRETEARHVQSQSWGGLVMERASFSLGRQAPAR
jgi:hypothetical protein